MSFKTDIFKAPSSDGVHTLTGKVYCPEGEARGFFHVVHGMAEHIGRYDAFMSRMANEGWICFGYDHLGHGATVSDDSELGFIAEKKGYEFLISDVKVYSDAVIEKYGKEKGINCPYVLMGHSMGSFVVRLASERAVTPDKLIIMGTGGKNPLASVGLAMTALVKLFCGKKHISKMINSMAFGSYNKRFGGGTQTDPSPWLTTDADARKAYYGDDLCGFDFTVSAMGDLIRMNRDCNTIRWYKSFHKDCPVLLVSGSDDPVGNYSRGVLAVQEGLEKQGVTVECIVYQGARHEILNDFTSQAVTEDIITFSSK